MIIIIPEAFDKNDNYFRKKMNGYQFLKKLFIFIHPLFIAGCKINGKCVFPADFKDAFGLRLLCHRMRCTSSGFVKSQRSE